MPKEVVEQPKNKKQNTGESEESEKQRKKELFIVWHSELLLTIQSSELLQLVPARAAELDLDRGKLPRSFEGGQNYQLKKKKTW